MKRQFLIDIVLGGLFLFVAIIMLLKVPVIWPDEAIYADVASNLIHEGRLGTDIWGNMIPGIKNCACWYPPLFFYSLASWEKIFGLSIESQRMLSVFIGLIFLFVVSKLMSHLLDKQKGVLLSLIAFIPVLLLILDPFFLKTARIGRPEIFVLLFGTASILFFLQKTHKNIILAGLFSSLAVLTHLIALIFPLAILLYLFTQQNFRIFKSKVFYFFLGSFLVPIFIGLIFFYSKISIIIAQVISASLQKGGGPLWISIIFTSDQLPLKILVVLYILISLMFIFYTIVNRKREYFLLSIILIITWIVAIFGRMEWYFIFPVPFTYMGLVIITFEKINKRKNIYPEIILICAILIMNFIILANQLGQGGGQKEYLAFTKQITDIIPDGKTVLLSSIPDAYYGFQGTRHNLLYEFAVLETDSKNIEEVVKNSDFVVYSQSFGTPGFALYLEKYLNVNFQNVYQIGTDGGYGAFVIELKPKSERINP